MKLATIAVVGILTLSPSVAYAACSATYPVGSTADSVVSFLASGTNLPFVGPTTFQAAEAGTLTYDSATNTLQLCNGTAWTAIATTSSAGSSGTAGYVQLSGGSGAFASSSTTAGQQLFWDTINHRLGIGTTSPGYPLDVVASIAGQNIVRLKNSNAGGLSGIDFLNSGGTLSGWLFYGNSVMQLGAYNSSPLQFATNNSTRMTIDNSGNVGIGTTSPTAPLDISKVSALGSGVYSGGTNFLRLFAAAGSTFSEQAIAFQEVGTDIGAKIAVKNQANGAYDIIFSNRDNSAIASTMTERMRILANGNVGIGTTGPSNKLHVQTSTANDGIVLSDGTRSIEIVSGTTGSGSWNGIVGANDSGIMFTGGTQDTGGFFIAPWGTTTKGIRILGSSGNVGIGVSNPSTKLQVNAGTDMNLRVTSGSASYGSTTGISIFSANDANNAFSNMNLAAANIIMQAGGGTGNVGIGTASPSVKMDVRGATRIDYDSANYDVWVQGGAGSSGTTRNLALLGAIPSDQLNINWYGEYTGGTYIHGTAGPALSVLANGNVGIGTTAPAAKLEVIGDTQYNNGSGGIRTSTSNGATANTVWIGASSVDDASTIQSYKIGTGAGLKSLLLNPNGGNVGIGTTSPGAKLHVAGALITDGSPTFGNASDAFTILTLNSKAASGVSQNPYIAWFRDATRQAYMGWGTPGTTFYLNMENSNQLYVTNTWGAVFSSDDVRKPSGGSFVASSDARLKDIKGDYTKGLTDIEKLNPVRYNYKAGNPRKEPSGKEFVGLIAQDVQKIFPDAVKEERDGYLSLDPSQFTYALINAVQELKAANDNLAIKVEQQTNEFDAYKAAHP